VTDWASLSWVMFLIVLGSFVLESKLFDYFAVSVPLSLLLRNISPYSDVSVCLVFFVVVEFLG
jgi:hypothetical protein